MGTPPPRLAVVLATRNRGHRVLAAVASILACDDPSFELIVVDQSDDDETRRSLEPHLVQPRLRYERSREVGLSRARNLGVSLSSADIIAFTDDDCVVGRDWLRHIRDAFHSRPKVGVLFGDVVAASHDATRYYIPTYHPPRPCVVSSILQKHRVEGLGACMAIRRAAWQEVGGFDALLGVGARFQAGEETDFAIRALLAGHDIFETPAATVEHVGVRSLEEAARLVAAYRFGTGAVYAKLLKCRQPVMLHLLVLGWRFLSTRRDRISHAGLRRTKLLAFMRGMLAGLCQPVDRQRCLFHT